MTTLILGLILVLLSVTTVYVTLLAKYVKQLLVAISSFIAEDYKESVQIQKIRQPSLSPAKQQTKGRNVVNTEELVDIADLDWETGYKAIEELGNV